MVECPECDRDDFDSVHGRNIHYGHEHGELPEELKEENEDPPTTPEFTEEHRQKLSESQQGENNSMYGVVGPDHPSWNPEREYHGTRANRDMARERDDYTCQDCGITDEEYHNDIQLDVHHIDRDPHNHDLDNLVTLCRSCHMQRHKSN